MTNRSRPIDVAESYARAVAQAQARVGDGISVGNWYGGNPVELRAEEDGDTYLQWGFDPAQQREVRPTDKLLLRFVNLADGTDEQIADFAHTFGPLGLCERHAFPLVERAGSIVVNPFWDQAEWERSEAAEEDVEYHHNPASPSVDYWDQCRAAEVQDDAGTHTKERTENWREYARLVRALIRLGMSINAGEDGDSEAWADLGIDKQTLLHSAAATFPSVLNHWIAAADLRLGVALERDDPPRSAWTLTPQLKTQTLFAGIVSEVMAAVAAPGRYAYCDQCGVLYAPSRKPNPSRRKFCPACVEDGWPGRWAARDYKARKKSGVSAMRDHGHEPNGDGDGTAE